MKRSDKDWQDHAEQKLWELVDGAEVETEKMDKDGKFYTLRSKLPPNIEAVKFALKNRAKNDWVEKTESVAASININLTASMDEVRRLMEQEKMQCIEGEVIENTDSARQA